MRILAVSSPDKAAASAGGYDAVVLVGHDPLAAALKPLKAALKALAASDQAAACAVNLVPADGVAGGRLIVSPTGPLGRDFDDVRRHADADAVREAKLDRLAFHDLLDYVEHAR